MEAGNETLVPSVLAVLMLDSDGNRIIAKYYRGYQQGAEAQAKFEAKLFKKTKNTTTTRNDAVRDDGVLWVGGRLLSERRSRPPGRARGRARARPV